ncbi:hypothetical protein GCM10011450_18160 [Advenella faeciporci]|uniref:Alkylphosphonate utilization protein n=1 Tax=Advenella faeciporci TaxID=797535 RepID=A0A918MYJ4_9BURK|nr:zinc ribbon domain-containing protein YjdM [Advenella faeciporci]GGW88468.1 hypothetical protein GCM10011450_18160 [Advenella faeciporci]
MSFPPCPQCASELAYNDGIQWVCPECGHEWLEGEQTQSEEGRVVKDSNGTVLQDGDSVTLIKDLKIKGSSQVIKQGTKVKNIRIVEGDHDIACKIEGTNMMLKSEFLKKI